MEFNPVSTVVTLIGGLALAGILGWIRRPRLVVFVPRLFSHSKISDQGQIVEISVMNRGFKTEEAVELSLNPQLHYELIGSNNPDAALQGSRLTIPRIGSADDCSVLLQVEKGRFTHEEIVSCLSKETKGVLKTKLEEIPVTAQQRVGILAFVAFLALAGVLGFKGLDILFDNGTPASSSSSQQEPAGLQGWQVSKIYEGNALYESLKSGKIEVSLGAPKVKNGVAAFPVKVSNQTAAPITFSAYTTAAASQDRLEFEQKRISDRLLFPSVHSEYTLMAVVGKTENDRQVLVNIFLEGGTGETLAGKQLVRVE